MSSKRVGFSGAQGAELSARLDLPDNQKPHNVVLFAHCFTCSKNLSAVGNISRALNDAGFAVLRFDFTGLGESEGDFSDTNFSSNIGDLKAAAAFLEKELMAPSLIVGHSLGGAAVIFAAAEIPSIKAVATIGAPSSPDHVKHLFSDGIDAIKAKGKAEVSIGGRPFTLSANFVEDISNKNMKRVLGDLRKPIIVFHSPQDTTVGIKNAEEIYAYAHHPKSYVSLDGADHLLTNRSDSEYVGTVIAGWAKRYVEIPERTLPKTRHQVAVSLGNEGFTSEIVAGKHHFLADEPEKVGGKDFGPSPYELVSAGLGACTAMTLRMYATQKKWDLQKVVVHLNHQKEYPADCKNVEVGNEKMDVIRREIQISGNLDANQRQRLLQIANKCPVHKTLTKSSLIETTLIKE